MDIKSIGERIIFLKFAMKKDIFKVISVYALWVGIKFSEDLESVIHTIPVGENIFFRGDLNQHVRRCTKGFESIHGGYGKGESNMEGQTILDFPSTFDFTIVNMCFKKREENLITYTIRFCLDFKVISRHSLTTQHRVLVITVTVESRVKIKGQHRV
ncbi:hypothetical protein Lal_00011295 [Lupinus albus]|nr:hypothetical protein Lal_00011295 [Lupinus albus]